MYILCVQKYTLTTHDNITAVDYQQQYHHYVLSDGQKKVWNCKFLIAGEKNASFGSNNNFEYKLHMVHKDSGGRFTICLDEEKNGYVTRDQLLYSL